ncbi:hypothetical protein J7M28_00930 [bacterium]|nr:hypothetical protein [bacterium]
MKNRRLWAFALVCLLLVPCIGLSQKRAVQERDTDRFTFTFGVKTLFMTDTELQFEDFDVYFDGLLAGPMLSVQIANTESFWDNFEFNVSTYFGDLDAYDSSGLGLSADYIGCSLDITDVKVDVCYRIIPYLGAFIDYRYRKYRLSRGLGEWPQTGSSMLEDEMYAGGLGLKGALPLGETGVFAYGSGEWIPYAEYLNSDSSAWGATLKAGLGYAIEGGEWLPVALTMTTGYRYHIIDSDGYFDERTDSGTADIVVSW